MSSTRADGMSVSDTIRADKLRSIERSREDSNENSTLKNGTGTLGATHCSNCNGRSIQNGLNRGSNPAFTNHATTNTSLHHSNTTDRKDGTVHDGSDEDHQEITCCQAENKHDQYFQEGEEFLNEIAEIILNESLAQGVDVNSKVVEFVQPAAMETLMDFRLEDEPMSKVDLVNTCRDVIRYSVKTGHPHFFNQLFGGLDPYALSGAWLTDVLNTSQYTFEVGPVFTIMEKFLFAEMRRLVGFKEGDGIFCPGGSVSNMYSINLARYNKFPEAKTKGMWHLPEMCILTSEKGHYSMKKGAALLGLGMDHVIPVKADQCGRMIPAELDKALTLVKEKGMVPIMVNATAGSTVLGAYDPLVPISDICRKHECWMHVDAAWGGGVLLSDKLRTKMDGVERADSVAWNPHKMMGAPLQAAVFLTRHENLLSQCNSAKAKYLFQQDKFYDVSYDTGDKSVQCGRKVDVLKVWLMWKAKGTRRFAADIEHLFHCSQYITKKLSTRPGFRLVLQEPECTNVCFWYIPPRMRGQPETKEWWAELGKVAPKIKERMVMAGTILIGYQPEEGLVNFFRLVVSNSAVKREDMDFVADEIERLGRDL